ncbi:Calcineurin subunit B-like protein 2 [Elsinoe fawcettii]|nr:Calcineurin subunit B-like protein 2 [Elsinoe fawcettii]
MSSSATNAAVTRYRPAVLVATGLAAAYGTYLIYRGLSYSEIPPPRSNGLHRSNAVHRPNRHRRISIVTFISYDHQDRLFPDCICAVDDRQYSFSLAQGGPSRSEVLSALRLSPHETDTVIHEMQLPALDQIFHVIINAPLDSEIAQNMSDIRDALDARDSISLLALEEIFTLGRWTFDLNAFHTAVAAWCARNTDESPAMIRSSVITRRTIDDDAETIADESDNEDQRDPGQNLKGLLYHIAEEEAKRSAYIHRGTRCDSCNQLPIKGVRWHCLNCPDFDLCSACEALGQHPRTHVFAKITIPISPRAQPREMHPLWYPGSSYTTMPERLPPQEKKDLSDRTGFNEPEIDALHDQFCCLASPFKDGEDFLDNIGIDRFTFHKIFAGDRAKHPIAPNYLYDRLFDFYDEDKDGQITFTEFVHGLAYLNKPAKRRSLEKVFKGYDADDDGYVSRADMVRMLRAKYIIHKEMTMDIVAIEDAQPQAYGRNLAREMRSNRTLSSMFSDAEIPRGETRRPYNKPVDEFGDPQVLPDPLFSQSILPNGQTDIDVQFWEAVFKKHGRSKKLSDLHPQFNDSLDARLRVRSQYTGSESLELDASDSQGERYLLVPADSRRRRPITSDQETLADEWKQDIADVKAKVAGGRTNGHTDATESDEAFKRDQTIVVTPEERDLGDEVLYQVIEDAINEILDELFAKKEGLSRRVQETKYQRDHHRKEIDDFVNQRANFELEEVAHGQMQDEDDVEDEEDDLFGKQDEYVNSTTLEEDRSARSASPPPEEHLGPSDTSLQQLLQSSNLNNNAQASEDTQRPQLRQSDIIDQIRSTAVPTDENSLQTMEQNIRNQDLDSLLAAAGYAVDDTIDSRPLDTAQEQATETESVESDEISDAEHDRLARVNVSLADFRNTQRPSGFGNGPGGATNETGISTFVVPDSSSSRSSDETSSEPADKDEEELRELPWTPASVRRSEDDIVEDSQMLEDSSDAGESHADRDDSSMDGATFDAPVDTNGLGTDAQPSLVEPDQPPTATQLEEFAMLDEEERIIRKRGGPARLNLQEFEAVVWADEAKEWKKKGVKGVVEGWLEWAFF